MNEQKNTINLEHIFKGCGLLVDESQELNLLSILDTFLECMEKAEGKFNDILKLTEHFIQEKVNILSQQLDLVIHHPYFKDLEGRWRGLHRLIFYSDSDELINFEVMNASDNEIDDDFDKSSEFDQSWLFKEIYEHRNGTLGGSPFTCIVYDHYFSATKKSVDRLTNLSAIGAAAKAPILSSITPDILNLQEFEKIVLVRDVAKAFTSIDKITWNECRSNPDSRFVCLSMPGFICRAPWHAINNPAKEVAYTETVNNETGKDHPLSNSAYYVAGLIARAFHLYRWPMAINGVEGGGLVEELPLHLYQSKDGEMVLRCPVTVSITDRTEHELSKVGITAFCHHKLSSKAVTYCPVTLYKPSKYSTDAATANDFLQSQLGCVLTGARFSHYIGQMLRDKIGSALTPDEIADKIQSWISGYVLLNENASAAAKASAPLKMAKIFVHDKPGVPGSYLVRIMIIPIYLCSSINVTINMVTEIPGEAPSPYA